LKSSLPCRPLHFYGTENKRKRGRGKTWNSGKAYWGKKVMSQEKKLAQDQSITGGQGLPPGYGHPKKDRGHCPWVRKNFRMG